MKLYIIIGLLISLMPMLCQSARAEEEKRPFPQHTAYREGTYIPSFGQARMDAQVSRLYDEWKSKYYRRSPYDPDQGYIWWEGAEGVTVSEAHGCGMRPQLMFGAVMQITASFGVGAICSVLESARLDGAGEWKILWSIVMPMVKPAWLTLVLLAVQGTWNDAYSPALYIHDEALKPMSVLQGYIAQAGFVRTGASAAFALVMLFVPVGTFILSQSNVIETMKPSDIKE